MQVNIAGLPAGGAVELSDLGALGESAVVAWLVPGLLLSLPGLLIFLVILGQAALATIFVPVSRRVLGAKEGTSG